MKAVVRNFFIAKGEIDDENKLDTAAYDICDGTDIGTKEKGIYVIRTVYRTDGNDYLFFKNGADFEILDFKDLQLLTNKTFDLYKGQTAEEIYNQLECLLKWYKETYLFKIKNKKKV
ncbi:hypothetical protein AM493_08960 [Flavobacterium akiainvivens]|uniref:Uncharacterized protein n=2 Tax=Flavobacterium akiainvivens TaxID=1202724 RepID=A0A0M8MHY6_9FLAO|nr:hypothetical protein AM493_08960 [Flavobacterium akiainvivens]